MKSSRLRADVVTYFDVCCEVHGGELNDDRTVKVLYPSDFNDAFILQSIKQFCFPNGNERCDGEAVQLFTFVLTDAQSQYTFGYCRLMPVTNMCLCILSGLTWTNHFYKFLNHLSNVMMNGNKEDLESLLTNAYHIDIPEEGGTLRLNACTDIGKFVDEISVTSKLSTLRTDKCMLEFYNAVSEIQMIALYASILKERRIVFTGRKLSQLSSCVFALSRLIYPFYWQNLFIPILPRELTDMLMAPMPYIIGVLKSTFCQLNKSDAGDFVLVDLDKKTFDSPHTDTIPSDAMNFLRNRLKKSASEMFLSDGLARSFLQTNVLIFGKYMSGIINEAGTFKWNKQLFVDNQRLSIQPFLSSILSRDGVQYFERFIEERLDALNKGMQIEDEFEKELKSTDLRRFLEKQTNVVRENASDVIVALKDRVQSISIKDKFGRFTPKEVRRYKLRSTKPTKKKASLDPLSIDASQYHFNNPLSSLNNVNDLKISSNNGNLDENGWVSDAESVYSTGDLIDLFDDNKTERPNTFYADSSPSSAATAAANATIDTNIFTENKNIVNAAMNQYFIEQAGTSVPTRFNDFVASSAFASLPPSSRINDDSNAASSVNPTRLRLPFTNIYDPINNGFSTSTSTKTPSAQRKNWETFE